MEALGIDLQLTREDLAARGNFATVDENGKIVDRRAKRISTEKNKELCQMLQNEIEEVASQPCPSPFQVYPARWHPVCGDVHF